MAKRYFVVKGGEGSGRYPKGSGVANPSYTFEQPRYPDNEGWSPEHPLEGNLGTITPEIEGENRTFDLGTIARSMAEASLWSTGEMDDKSFYDINPDDAYGLIGVATDFVRNNLSDLVASDLSDDEIGHDLALTIDGHGSGFWDRGLGEVGKNLTQACKSYIGSTPEVGDDGQVYFHLNPTVRKGGVGSGRYPAGSGKADRLNAIFQSDKAHADDLTSKASLTSVLAQRNPENQIVIQNHISLAREYADMAETVKREMNETVGAPMLARSFATDLYGALRNASKAHETASELGMEMLDAIGKDEEEHDGLLSEATQDLASDFVSASNYASDASNAVSLAYESAPSYTEVSGEMFRNKARFAKSDEPEYKRRGGKYRKPTRKASEIAKGGPGSGRYPAGSGSTTYDFGNGHEPAHQHSNGGGWVADTATVADTAFVGKDAQVFGNAQVRDFTMVTDKARVGDGAVVEGTAQVEGNAVISDGAIVSDNARVEGNAKVFGYARVGDGAVVSENAKVGADAQIYGNAKVFGNAVVMGEAWVYGDAQVFGTAVVSGKAMVCEQAQVFGNAIVGENAEVRDNAQVDENAHVRDYAQVYDNARVFGNAIVGEQAQVFGNALVGGNTRVMEDTQVSGGNVQKGGAGSGRFPKGSSGQVVDTKGVREVSVPANCGARDFDPNTTISQMGRMNILAISGGRVNPIMVGKQTVGLELPVGQGYKVRVYLGDNDTYTVQRVQHTARGEKILGQLDDVYADEVGEQAYQASCFISNPFGGHEPH